MGAYCTKHCAANVPNTRLWRRGRRGHRRSQTMRNLEARASQCDCSRLRSVRDTAFRSGFSLGLKVRTLERLLHMLDDDSAELSAASANQSYDRKSCFGAPPDPDPAAADPGPQCSLTNMIKEDFRWVLEPEQCEGHHPGSPNSLP